jgi:tRNA uridine 5-carboxymethylaminomethyl modification enzyme
MFTSRAEYRLLLREDNADERLTVIGRELGLVDDARWEAFQHKQAGIADLRTTLQKHWIHRDSPAGKDLLARDYVLSHEVSALDLLKRPEINFQILASLPEMNLDDIPEAISTQLEIQEKYAGYIKRQQEEIERTKKHEDFLLPSDLDFYAVPGLSTEERQKLTALRPQTLGQASRIPGVTPSAISLLLVYLKRQ